MEVPNVDSGKTLTNSGTIVPDRDDDEKGSKTAPDIAGVLRDAIARFVAGGAVLPREVSGRE